MPLLPPLAFIATLAGRHGGRNRLLPPTLATSLLAGLHTVTDSQPVKGKSLVQPEDGLQHGRDWTANSPRYALMHQAEGRRMQPPTHLILLQACMAAS